MQIIFCDKSVEADSLEIDLESTVGYFSPKGVDHKGHC